MQDRYESALDRQIRMARERGEFDDLPGKGKPLPGLDGPLDEDWWIRGYLRREGISGDALLPEPLLLRKEIDRLPETVRGLPGEREVREVVAVLNRRIVDWLRTPLGPRVRIGRIDADAVVRDWRAGRAAAERAVAGPARPATPVEPEQRRWWGLRRGR